MKTVTINLYKFQELEGDAKEKARQWLTDLDRFDYVSSDAWYSVQEFAKHFPIEVRSISFLESYRNQYRLTIEDEIKSLSGLRLRSYIINNFGHILWKPKYLGHLKGYTEKPIQHKRVKATKNRDGLYYHSYYSGIQVQSKSCNLTGVCYDESLLAPFYKFIEKPDNSDLEDLLEAAIYSICKDVESEIEANCEDAALIEHCEANGYQFDENGNIA